MERYVTLYINIHALKISLAYTQIKTCMQSHLRKRAHIHTLKFKFS